MNEKKYQSRKNAQNPSSLVFLCAGHSGKRFQCINSRSATEEKSHWMYPFIELHINVLERHKKRLWLMGNNLTRSCYTVSLVNEGRTGKILKLCTEFSASNSKGLLIFHDFRLWLHRVLRLQHSQDSRNEEGSGGEKVRQFCGSVADIRAAGVDLQGGQTEINTKRDTCPASREASGSLPFCGLWPALPHISGHLW